MTTDAARLPRALFRRPSGPLGSALLGFAVTLVLGVALLVGASLAVAAASSGRVLAGVRAGGIELGGLDRAAALERLRTSLPSLSDGFLRVTIDGETASLPFAQLGRGYELEAMADEAYALGRSGDPIADAAARLRSLLAPSSVPVQVHAFDRDRLDRAVVGLALRFTRDPADASVALGEDGTFVVTPASAGTRADPRVLRTALIDVLQSDVPGDVAVSVAGAPRIPAVSTEQAEAAAEAARSIVAGDLALLTGADDAEPVATLSAGDLAALVGFGAAEDGTYGALLDRSKAVPLLDGLAPDLAQEAENASYRFADGPVAVVPAVEGRALDVAASLNALAAAFADRAAGRVVAGVPLAFATTQPALTTEAATAALPKMERLGTWTTYYVPGDGNFWGANISIPANDVNGLTLAPGEWFSYWDDIGPVTTARGYGCGGAIINGRSVPCGALGGGMCSTSTTLFNAAMRSGLEMGDRTNHSYYIERYPVGLDATVLQTDTSETNMTFRNDMANPIMIRAYTGSGFVRFDIWGVPDGRTVTLSKPRTWGYTTAVEKTYVDPSMKPGTSRRVEYPHNGFHASVTRWVHDAQGNLLWENVWESNYRTINGQTWVGPPAAPKPSDPPST